MSLESTFDFEGSNIPDWSGLPTWRARHWHGRRKLCSTLREYFCGLRCLRWSRVDVILQATSFMECQQLCTQTEGCEHFTFFEDRNNSSNTGLDRRHSNSNLFNCDCLGLHFFLVATKRLETFLEQWRRGLFLDRGHLIAPQRQSLDQLRKCFMLDADLVWSRNCSDFNRTEEVTCYEEGVCQCFGFDLHRSFPVPGWI